MEVPGKGALAADMRPVLREVVETPLPQGRAPRPAMVSGLMVSDLQLAAGYTARAV
jgi:hypothetical protein